MKIERNRKASSGKHSRHINIRYFFIKDRVKSGEASIIYYPTDDMIANFCTKILQGTKFYRFRSLIIGDTMVVLITEEIEHMVE